MRCVLPILACLAIPLPAWAQCGGSFSGFVKGLQSEAVSRGYDAGDARNFFANVSQDP